MGGEQGAYGNLRWKGKKQNRVTEMYVGRKTMDRGKWRAERKIFTKVEETNSVPELYQAVYRVNLFGRSGRTLGE